MLGETRLGERALAEPGVTLPPMRSLTALVLLAACGSGANVAIVTGVRPLRNGSSVWIIGIARNAKQGALVDAAGQVIYCADRPEWPPNVAGTPVVVAGTLATRSLPPPPVGPKGERSAGAQGNQQVVSSCAPPPPDADGALVAAERALFAALATRDGVALARLTAPELILRIPGQPDADRTAFVKAVTATPGEILGVDGQGITSHRSGDTGIVRGVQVARVRLDGKVIEDRGTFVDVFVRRGGAWVLTFALNVPAP
jgi:hypothetical protein